jgi:hypothetical protein
MSANGFKWKERNKLVIFVFFDQMCTTLLICIQSMHFLFVSSINAYKCHIINFLLTSLARSLQRNIGPRSFCTNSRINLNCFRTFLVLLWFFLYKWKLLGGGSNHPPQPPPPTLPTALLSQL